MKSFAKELPWIVLASTLGLCISFVLGLNIFEANSTVDINIHDTYYVIGILYPWLAVMSLTVFVFYSIRSIQKQFTNLNILLVLAISGICSITFLTKLTDVVDLLGNTSLETFISLNPENKVQQEIFTFWKIISNSVIGIQLLILILLIFFTYKTGTKRTSN